MKRPSVSLDELSPEVRAQLANKLGMMPTGGFPNGSRRNEKRSRETFPKDKVREYALRVLAVIPHLAPAQRARVLELAQKINKL